MILLIMATCLSTLVYMIIEYFNDQHANTNVILFLSEFYKLVFAVIVTQWMVP